MHDPLRLFKSWFRSALKKESDPTAFSLATVDKNYFPHNRMLLLKDFDTKGFVFYTNLKSNKSLQLTGNKHAAMCFYWKNLYKQVRIEGTVQLVSDAVADHYFQSRPRASQISAWASTQSHALKDPKALSKRVQFYKRLFSEKPVPRPKWWSGYCLVPQKIEFWKGGPARLHTRVLFEHLASGRWKAKNLFP